MVEAKLATYFQTSEPDLPTFFLPNLTSTSGYNKQNGKVMGGISFGTIPMYKTTTTVGE